MSAGRPGSGRARVIHLVESLGVGGLERVVETLVTGLDPDRYEPRVLTLAGEGALASAIREQGVPVERAPIAPVLRPSAIGRLAARLRDLEADVVHGHGYLAGTMARLAGAKAGARCLVTHRHTTGEGERLRHRLLTRMIRGRGWTICCSEAVRQAMVSMAGADPLRTEVIYNGVPLHRFAPAPGRGGAPRLVCVASLRSIKGQEILLQAAARLKSSGLRPEILLIGEGPDREYLARIAGNIGIADQVRLLGVREDVAGLLARDDIFVLPNRSREGLSLAVLEAMASGLPVIASRIGGIPEAVRHERTGLLVEPGDPAALAGAIASLLGDPALAAAMGAAGRERVERHFTSRAMVERTQSLYERDLGRQPAGRAVIFLSSRGTHFGGGQASLRMLVTSLDGARYRPVVVLPEPGSLSAELSASGVCNLVVPMPRLRPWRIHGILRAAMRLRKLAAMAGAKVVHVDATRGAFYALALPRSVRRVWHLRDVRPDRFDRFIGARFDRLVAVSREVAERRFPGVKDGRLRIVPNAVPEARMERSREEVRRDLGIGPGEILVLAAGRVEPEKGTEELIVSLAKILESGAPVRVVVAGEASPAHAAKFEGIARRLGVAGSFRLLGPREDLGDLMRAADLFVHASWYEAAPRVVLEAMASRLAVVASAVGGVPEILQGCGELVPRRDALALAEAVARMAKDPRMREERAGKARARYEELYTPERHLAAIQALYGELVDAPSPGGAS